MRVSVRLFAGAREAVGDRIDVEVAGDPPTAAALLARLGDDPRLAAVVARSRLAVGNAFASAATPLQPGVEVALIPPVGGG